MKALLKPFCALLIVLAAAQHATNGRVLSVEKTQAGGRPAWRVKIVTSKGDVMVILVDAASGRVL